jgi:glycosyltransferase involved in cell wall biosynthesis
MKISVITIALNVLPELRKTVDSVICQSFGSYEYIVVDGASTDGTAEYLNKEKGINKWISEPDNGIYEAMNKGTRMATGDYCIFMNAGDRFVDNYVLSKIAPHLDGTDFVLGNEVIIKEGRVIDYYPSKGSFTLKNLLQSSTRHQSIFIRRNVLIDHPYDESLRLVSDWKFTLECFLDGRYSFKTVNIDICLFAAGGATLQFFDDGRKERMKVLSAYPDKKYIWGQQYNPSFWVKVRNKFLYFMKSWQYKDFC